LDERTLSGYFFGYPEKFKGYLFYCPTYSTRLVESRNVLFNENGETSGSESSQNVEINEVRVKVPIVSIYSSRIIVHNVVETHTNKEEQQINDPEVNNVSVVE